MHNLRRKTALILAGIMVTGSLYFQGAPTFVKAAKEQETQVNLIENGTFTTSIDGWGSYLCKGGDASFTQEAEKLKIDINNVSTVNYGVQASCAGFHLYHNGKYRLSFDINSTVERDMSYRIQLNGGDYHAYVEDQITVDTVGTTIVKEFTMKDVTDMAPVLGFNMGYHGEDGLAPHAIYIDNVSLELIDGSNISCEEEEEEIKINLNQNGYQPNDRKTAVVRQAEAGQEFKVVSISDDTTVYTGTIGEGTYNIGAAETDFTADFSDVTASGVYKIVMDGIGESYQFKIAEDIYNPVMKDAMRFFYLQRCGEITKEYGSVWAHPACHQQKARIYGTQDYIDVSGGWHDAGDYGRYIVATSKTVADLLLAYDANKYVFGDNYNIPESGNGVSDLIDEIENQLVWMQKMQDKTTGGVYHKVTTAGFPGYITADQETDELIVCPISNQATGDFAAVMAMGYDALKDIKPEFANQCLKAGEAAYKYLETAPSSVFRNPTGVITGEYGDNSDSDERYFATAALYKATGKEDYHNDFKAFVAEKVLVGYSWSDVGSIGNVLYLSSDKQDTETAEKIKDAMISQADYVLALSKEDQYGISNHNEFYWGSNSAVSADAVVLMDAYKLTGNEEYKTYAKEHLNYLLGKNPMAMSYVTGFGEVSPLNPHHRPSIVAGCPIPGAVAGGPNMMLQDPTAKGYLSDAAPAKCYIDSAESYSTNEVDIYWNSPFVLAMAQLGCAQDNLGEAVKTVVKANTTVQSTNVSQKFQISVTDCNPADLSKVSVRYYYSCDNSEELKCWCDCAHVVLKEAPWYQNLHDTTNVEVKQDDIGSYMEITFDEAMMIPGNGATVCVDTRLTDNSWATLKNFTEGETVVYYDGIKIK